MSPDHAITPEIIQRELVRLTATGDRPSKVMVFPDRVDGVECEVARIVFVCDDIPMTIVCMPLDMVFLSLDEFSDRVLVPMADAWATEKARLREEQGA